MSHYTELLVVHNIKDGLKLQAIKAANPTNKLSPPPSRPNRQPKPKQPPQK